MFRIQVENSFGNISQELELFSSLNEAQLSKIAQLVKKGIEKNIERGETFNGLPVRPLATSTIKKKGNARLFFDTGELFKSISLKRTNKDVYEIFVNGNRSRIAYYLQYGTSKMPARPFFGITRETDKEIDKILEGNNKNLT